MHKLPDRVLITPGLLDYFHVIARGGPHWALIQKSDGAMFDHDPGPEPVADQKMFACDTINALNRNLDHDGAWAIVFCDPAPPPFAALMGADYQRFVLISLNEDGKPRFVIESDRPFIQHLEEGIHAMLEAAEGGFITWWQMTRDYLKPVAHHSLPTHAPGTAPAPGPGGTIH
jgi:hypothetical protein